MSTRLPAEWEKQEVVLLSWPHADTDWAYMLDEVTRCYIEVATAISKRAKLLIVCPDIEIPQKALKGKVAPDRVAYAEMPTNDTWARDFGMLCTKKDDGSVVINDFMFNGWGLKFAANHDNLITLNLSMSDLISEDAEYNRRLDFVLEGGSIDVDEDGNLLTTSECLLSLNRNGILQKKPIEDELKKSFGVDNVMWLDSGYLAGDDTDSHVDTLARFIPGKAIAYTACDRKDDEHFDELHEMEGEIKALGYSDKLYPLPIPRAIYDQDGQRLPATYANFLLINGAVMLPVYGDAKYDKIAIDTMKKALPDWEIVPIDCRALIQQHGSLHCITMQIPEGVFSL